MITRTYRSVPTPEFARKSAEVEVKFSVSDITALTTKQINVLHVGDFVAKEDSTGKHTYTVSYKKEKTGICLTYTDASVVETVSYDYTAGNWVYNSTDVTPLGGGSDSGLKLYKHKMFLHYDDADNDYAIYSTIPSQATGLELVKRIFDSSFDTVDISGNRYIAGHTKAFYMLRQTGPDISTNKLTNYEFDTTEGKYIVTEIATNVTFVSDTVEEF